LRRLSDADLYRYIAGWREGTEHRLAGEAERARRQAWPARVALILSVVSLIVAVLALFKP
jgi:hypothetical protein